MKHNLHRVGLLRPLLLVLALLIGSGGGAWAETVTDVINYELTSSELSSTANNTWKDFTVEGASGVQYWIHSMGTKNGTEAIRWNANGYLSSSAPTRGGSWYMVPSPSAVSAAAP